MILQVRTSNEFFEKPNIIDQPKITQELLQQPHLQQQQSAIAAVAAMNIPPPLQYPCFAPGLIPRPMFPWSMNPKGIVGAQNPVIPPIIPQRFFPPKLEQNIGGRPHLDVPFMPPATITPIEQVESKAPFNSLDVPCTTSPVQSCTITPIVNSMGNIPPVVPMPLLPLESPTTPKINKPDKIEKVIFCFIIL